MFFALSVRRRAIFNQYFSAMLESAARLCDASFGNIFRWDDDALRLVATYNTPAAFVEARSHLPLRRDQNNPIGEMLAAKTVLHVHDLAADERYINRRDPNIIAAVEQGVCVPKTLSALMR
jgi:hypothetical protein